MLTRKNGCLARALLVIAFATGLSATTASAQVIFSMDYSAGAYPAAGWSDPWPENEKWRKARVPGGGPTGQDAIEMTQLYAPNSGSYGGQHYWGWYSYLESQNPAQGSRRFYRWRMKFSADSNFRSRSWGDGHATGSENKVLIVGDTCGSNCRVIVTYDADATNRRIGNFRVQIDGGANLVDTPPQPVGQWLDIQIELVSSTSTSSGNGGYKIWINNNDYNNPTAQRSGFQLNTTNWRLVGFGYFANHGLASDGIHKWTHSNFQVASAFASNWHGGGSQTPPAPVAPSNVRILR